MQDFLLDILVFLLCTTAVKTVAKVSSCLKSRAQFTNVLFEWCDLFPSLILSMLTDIYW